MPEKQSFYCFEHFFLSLISLILLICPSIMLGGPGPGNILDSLILSFVGQEIWDRVDWGGEPALDISRESGGRVEDILLLTFPGGVGESGG